MTRIDRLESRRRLMAVHGEMTSCMETKYLMQDVNYPDVIVYYTVFDDHIDIKFQFSVSMHPSPIDGEVANQFVALSKYIFPEYVLLINNCFHDLLESNVRYDGCECMNDDAYVYMEMRNRYIGSIEFVIPPVIYQDDFVSKVRSFSWGINV